MASEKASPEDSAPELATAHDAPEVFRGQNSRSGQPYDSGLEVYSPPAASPEVAPYYAPHEKQSQLEHDVVEQRNYPYGGVNGGQYTSYRDAANDQVANGQDGQYTAGAEERRICGLRRKLFFWVVAIIAAIVILAIVLGAALGTTLGGSNNNKSSSSTSSSTSAAGPTSTSPSSSTASGTTTSSATPSSTGKPATGPPAIEDDTGLTVTPSTDGTTLYSYFQSADGTIVENQRVNGKWSLHGDDIPTKSVVATNARQGTPLQVISYASGLSQVRQMFFVATDNLLMTTDTSSGEWSSPYSILTEDNVVEGSIALSAVVDTNANGLNGIRVYYSSFHGWIQEVGRDFDVNPIVWNEWATFPGSDTKSGVASLIVENINHLYMLNTTTGALQQWQWNYVDITSWNATTKVGTGMAPGSDLAGAYDGAGNDYLFYANINTELVSSVVSGSNVKNLPTIADLADNSNIAATYWSQSKPAGPLVFFRAANNSSDITYELLASDGSVLSTGTE